MNVYVLTQPRASLGQVQFIVQPRARSTAIRRVRRPPVTLGALGAGVAAQIGKQAGTNAATIAIAAIPVVGPFIAPFVGLFTGLLGKHHAQAVAVEGQTLNVNHPNFLIAVQDTMNALNAGQISEDAAISALNQAQSAYYQSVSSIIKKSGQCKPSAADHGDRLHTDGMSSCNAACSIGCRIVEPAVYNLTKMIQAGGGTYTVPATPDNGAIAGTPAFTVSYTRGAGAGGALGGVAGGIPLWVWLGGGGLVLLLIVMGMRR